MRALRALSVLLMAALVAAGAQLCLAQQASGGRDWRAADEEIFELVNEARSQAGASQLRWDPALAAAALEHCRRMVAEGAISHQYRGEPELSERVERAGAHFSVVEENVATGPSPVALHDEWMNSPGHRANLLSSQVDRVGIAVIVARGTLYGVEDFSRAVESLSPEQVEDRVSALLESRGVAVLADRDLARAACALDSGIPAGVGSQRPGFVARWQSGSLDQLPDALLTMLARRQYRSAAVGSCAPRDVASFSAYRLAVLLY
jgi:uncharacterized protein YkwD